MITETYVVAGAITGFFVGLTGVGGGALMAPILILFFSVVPVTAVATDLWFAVLTKTVAALIHNKGGMTDWRIVRKLWLGSIPVALIIASLVSYNDAFHNVDWLSKAIGIVILITAVGLLFAPKLLSLARKGRISHPSKFKKRQPLLTIIAGAVLGFSVALTSVGAGALGSVMLLYLYPLRLTPHRLVATDIAHAIPLAFMAGLSYLIAGMVNVQMLISLLTGSIPAAIFGSYLAQRCSARLLQMILACVLIVSGLKML